MDAANNDNERAILDAWVANAEPWVSAVRSSAIGTRVRATDAAILKALFALSPKTALDVGCGEGWLTRTLADAGVKVVGVDAVASLVEAARAAGKGEYLCLRYDEISDGKLTVTVDAIVCNFSLFGEASVRGLISSFPGLLNPGGALLIQTVHPESIQTVHPESIEGVLPCESGWRDGSWKGCGPGFSDPAPWFFRTVEDWIELLVGNGFPDVEVSAPNDPASGAPASLLLVAKPAA